MSLLLMVAMAILSAEARPGGKEPSAEGKPVNRWIDELKDDDVDVRLHASSVLRGMGAAAVPYLVRVLQEDKSDARLRILTTLDGMGPSAEAALPALSALLSDSSLLVRVSAAATMVAVDCYHTDKPWPVLLAALEGGDSPSASIAAMAIGYLGTDGARAVPALARLVKSSDAQVRSRATRALWMIGPAAKGAVAALEDAAKEGDRSAADALKSVRGDGGLLPVPGCRDRRATQEP